MSFTVDLSKWVEKAGGRMDTVVKTVVIELGSRIVQKSPVGDAVYWTHPAPKGYVGGRFRANWQYGFNKMPGGEIDSNNLNGSATTVKLTSEVLASQQLYGMHYLVNNLPYAKRLEDGWSKRQAPAGVVRRTVVEFSSIVNRAAQKAKAEK